MAASAIQALSWATIAPWSSLTMRLAASLWPAASINSARVLPDLSEASSRLSETVRTAMLTGRKGRCSLIVGDMATIRLWVVESSIGRPYARGKRVELGCLLVEAQAVDPVIGQHPLGENARFAGRDAFEEQQRVVAVARLERFPMFQRARPAVIGDGEEHQGVALVVEQALDVFLRERQVDLGVGQLLVAHVPVDGVERFAGLRRHQLGGRRHQLHQAAGAGGAHTMRRRQHPLVNTATASWLQRCP